MKPCIGIFFIFIFLTAGCQEKVRPTAARGISSASLPSQEMWNSTITFTEKGILKAVVKAGHIATFENSRTTTLDSGVHVDFYNERGLHSSVLTSLRGQIDENTNNLEATGNVVVTSDSGVAVRTEKLFWDNKRQIIHSTEFVRITSPTERLQGYGFESDQNLRNYRIFRVSGVTEGK